ncbi:hypothetical protein JL193_09510 [Polaribacter batillariae]|uniref:DUF4157 domain-containing protein n=1 Tax=Polaribacter batillariae TaxID=2808900 RepID=A0ABX7SS87_9FLAO|nr:hypothetical protein [Polaribacter batillariae]QTD36396.1 hypothetical protein JL193_09510 [Polaribacter batillariae]
MGHEFTHVGQISVLGSLATSYSDYKSLLYMMEFQGYSYGSYLGSTNYGGFNAFSPYNFNDLSLKLFSKLNWYNYKFTTTARFINPF